MTRPSRVSIFAPATVANVGPGYDVLGLALQQPGDIVHAHRRADPGATLARVVPLDGRGSAPPAGATNTATIAADLTLKLLAADWGVELTLEKGLPVGSGLGSSGASAAAAAAAVNALAERPLPVAELIPVCAEAERVACGHAHADNVAPALLGGIVVVRPDGPPVRLQTRLGLQLAMITPRVEVPTRKARAAIPAAIPIEEVIENSARLASLVYALATDDPTLLGESLCDRIAEPRRAHLIPGFEAAKQAALDAGALGCSISGAGPSIFAMCADAQQAAAVERAMSGALTAIDVKHRAWTSPISPHGARPVST